MVLGNHVKFGSICFHSLQWNCLYLNTHSQVNSYVSNGCSASDSGGDTGAGSGGSGGGRKCGGR